MLKFHVLFILGERIATCDIRYPDYETGADISNNVLYLYLKF